MLLVGKLDGKRQLRRQRCKLADNTKVNVGEIGWGFDWIDVAQDRDKWRALVNDIMNLRAA
jgi:hypothetical protein